MFLIILGEVSTTCCVCNYFKNWNHSSGSIGIRIVEARNDYCLISMKNFTNKTNLKRGQTRGLKTRLLRFLLLLNDQKNEKDTSFTVLLDEKNYGWRYFLLNHSNLENSLFD